MKAVHIIAATALVLSAAALLYLAFFPLEGALLPTLAALASGILLGAGTESVRSYMQQLEIRMESSLTGKTILIGCFFFTSAFLLFSLDIVGKIVGRWP